MMNGSRHGSSVQAPRGLMRIGFRTALAILLCAASIPAFAQNGVPTDGVRSDEPPALTVESIAGKRQELAAELEEARKNVEAATESGGKPSELLQRTHEILQQLDLVLGQQASAIERSAELARLKTDIAAKQSALETSGLADQETVTFLQLDHARDELNAHLAKAETIEAATKAAEENLGRAKRNLEEREQARRQAREAHDANKDAANNTRLAGAQRLAMMQSRTAKEQVQLRRVELANEKAAAEVHEVESGYLKDRVALLEKYAQFTRSDLDDQLKEIDKKESDLNYRLQIVQSNLSYYDTQLFSAKQRLENETNPSQSLKEEVEAKNVARMARQTEINLLTHQRERLTRLRQVWDRRYHVARRSADVKILPDWKAESEEALRQLDRDDLLLTGRLADLRKDLVTAESKIDALEESEADAVRRLQEQKEQLSYFIEVYEAEIASVYAQRQMEQKLLSEIEGRGNLLSVSDWFEIAWDKVKAVWKIEIGTVDDEAITVGKIVTGIALVVIGLIVSRLFSTLLGKRVLPRFGMNQGAASVLQAVVFYCLVALSMLLALNLVNVPLTAFTVLGGAIAIGVGFGAQNIINNFISGWILIAERPVRIGDLVELDGVTGHVKTVGARCTRIRRSDGIDLLVPNSLMLERTVVNWTLSDIDIRTSVTVGVIYGSPTDQVARLIMRVVTRNEKVLAHPKPILIFEDFGDNALIFEVYFWIHATAEMDLRRAKSEVRFEIDRVFRAAGLVIAFPQRDVHLDTVSPIEVRMVDAAKQETRTVFDQQRERVGLLHEIDLFQPLADDEIDGLAHALTEHQFGPEQTIVNQDEKGVSLFIVVSGLLEVTVEENGKTRAVAQLIPGEFFGEMSLLTGEPRQATVTAVTESRVFELEKEHLAPIIRQRDDMAEALGKALAARERRNTSATDPHRMAPAMETNFVNDIRRRINSFFGLH